VVLMVPQPRLAQVWALLQVPSHSSKQVNDDATSDYLALLHATCMCLTGIPPLKFNFTGHI